MTLSSGALCSLHLLLLINEKGPLICLNVAGGPQGQEVLKLGLSESRALDQHLWIGEQLQLRFWFFWRWEKKKPMKSIHIIPNLFHLAQHHPQWWETKLPFLYSSRADCGMCCMWWWVCIWDQTEAVWALDVCDEILYDDSISSCMTWSTVSKETDSWHRITYGKPIQVPVQSSDNQLVVYVTSI